MRVITQTFQTINKLSIMDQNLLPSWGFEPLTSHTISQPSTDCTNVSHSITGPKNLIEKEDTSEKAMRRYRKTREMLRKNP
jgi:hypothetical protein